MTLIDFKADRVFVTGISCSGKTTYAKAYANTFGLKYIDFDLFYNYSRDAKMNFPQVFFNAVTTGFITDALPFDLAGERMDSTQIKKYLETNKAKIVVLCCTNKEAWLSRLRGKFPPEHLLNKDDATLCGDFGYMYNIYLGDFISNDIVYYDTFTEEYIELRELQKRIAWATAEMAPKDISPEFLKRHLDAQVYDKTYQDIDCIGFKGYSGSLASWDLIKDLTIWRDKDIVELGCFHGYYSFKFELCGAKSILGLDKDEAALATTRLIQKRNNLFQSAQYEVFKPTARFEHWVSGQPIPKCDVILCMNMLHHCPDQEAVVSAMQCSEAIFEINNDQIPLVEKYFPIVEVKIKSHRANRSILLCRKKLQPPEVVFITASTKCNYQCKFCYQDNIQSNDFMDIAKILESEDLLDGAERVDLSGYGEFIMHPQFKEMTTLLSRKKKHLSFSTNGSLLTKDIVDFLDTSTLSLLNISINSLNPETYAKITKTGKLSVLLDNLEYLFSKKRPYQITLSAVVTSYAIHELIDFVIYSREHGGHSVRFLPMAPIVDKVYAEELTLKDTPENRLELKRAEKLCSLFGITCQSFTFEPQATSVAQGNRNRCTAPYKQFLIGPKGDVIPCCWLGWKCMGSLQTSSWRDIWEGEGYKEFRASVVAGDSPYCKDCREFG